MQTEKQRERLVELLDNLPNGELLTKDVADYLMSNNVVVLPCKVGDNVFFLPYGEICEATVVNVEYNYYTNPQEWVTVEYRSGAIGTNKYKTRIDLMFGKTVFLTKAEAEAKLKEMLKENVK